MQILWALIVGLIVGAVAKLLMPGKDPGGVVITMLLGVAGSLVAGFLGRAFGWYHSGRAGQESSLRSSARCAAVYLPPGARPQANRLAAPRRRGRPEHPVQRSPHTGAASGQSIKRWTLVREDE